MRLVEIEGFWINADLVTSISSSFNDTYINFDKDHHITVRMSPKKVATILNESDIETREALLKMMAKGGDK